MSRDKYSNDHTIEILQENNFSVETDDGIIKLWAKGASSRIHFISEHDLSVDVADSFVMWCKDTTISASDDINLVADDNINLTANDDNINLTATDGSVQIFATEWARMYSYTGIWIEALGEDVDIKAEDSITIHAASDLDLKSDDDVTITASSVTGQVHASGAIIELDSSDTLGISAANNVTIGSLTGDLELACQGEMHIHTKDGMMLETTSGATHLALDAGGVEVQGFLHLTNMKNSGSTPVTIYRDSSTSGDDYVLRVRNSDGSDQSDGIEIDLNYGGGPPNLPGKANNWLQFDWAGTSKGAIQGARNELSNPFNIPNWPEYAYVVDGSLAGVPLDHLTAVGNAQFISGTADFGEFFEVGDAEEWGQITPDGPIFGLPEGIVVWVIGDKFFKAAQEGVGVPMLITKRAIIVGSGRPLLKNSGDQRFGEVLSFVGKLPALVTGPVGVGDLIIPIDNKNICRSLPKSEANLQDYMKAIGTALDTCPEESVLPDDHPRAPGEKVNIHALLCAVGVK